MYKGQGLGRAHEAGHDLARIHAVASFFVSRVDTEVDARLDAIGTEAARELKGKAAVANAQLAYQAYEEVFSTPVSYTHLDVYQRQRPHRRGPGRQGGARGHPRGDRLRGRARPDCSRAAREGPRPHPGRVDAVSGVVLSLIHI